MILKIGIIVFGLACCVQAGEVKFSTGANLAGNPIQQVSTMTFTDGSLMGSNTYFIKTSTGQSDTTSSTFQDKLVSTITLNGTYLLLWSAEVGNDTPDKATVVQLFNESDGEELSHSYNTGLTVPLFRMVTGLSVVHITQGMILKIRWKTNSPGG